MKIKILTSINENLQSEYLNDISSQCLNATNIVNVSSEEKINIYPNPVSEYLCIHFEDELMNEDVSVFSSFGIKYDTFSHINRYDEHCLDVKQPSGVFYVVIERKAYRFLKL